MQWTVRLEARTCQGEVTTTELVTFSRPVMAPQVFDTPVHYPRQLCIQRCLGAQVRAVGEVIIPASPQRLRLTPERDDVVVIFAVGR